MAKDVFSQYSPEEIEKAIKLLERQKEQRKRQLERIKNDPVARERQRERALRRRVREKLLIQKALESGITVSEEEIDAWLASRAS